MAQYEIVIRNAEIHDGLGSAPLRGDVAIADDLIAAVGQVGGEGRIEIDGAGLILTPGFVDIHTHYDGQAIWEQRLTPSSDHGVTTVVMGNCGVGFAPCRPADRERLVKLMEGIEDIPGVVMTEGLTWDWTSYPDYLDAIERKPHDINLASYFPHTPLRVFVMGERAAAGEESTEDDRARMAALTREAMEAGALGFATSRTLFHKSSDGHVVPTLDAGEQELAAVAGAMRDAGHGILQVSADFKMLSDVDGEFGVIERAARSAGRNMTVSLTESHSDPAATSHILEKIELANDDGSSVSGQIMPRGIGMLFGLDLSLNPFCLTPAYREIERLPLGERVAKMREPAMRAKILGDVSGDPTVPMSVAIRRFDTMFEMGDPLDYEPPMETSIAARAERMGITPEELAYDLLLRNDGNSFLYLPFANYAFGNLDTTYDRLRHPNVVLGLGDGGAHCGVICDAAYPTFLLTYWARDRTRGARLGLPEAIRALTSDTARTVGLCDRGVIRPGYRADLNLIDLAGLRLYGPEVRRDLPAGGRRLVQRADGYRMTIVNGRIVYREGAPTGELPGRLVRGPKAAPEAATAIAAE